jgi:excisionase family DNA binding protein
VPSRDAARDEGAKRSQVEARFLTLDDVATYLSVSVPQVYALVRSGELPAIKIGGRGVWRVDRNQLEAFVERLHHETETWAKEHPLNPRERA